MRRERQRKGKRRRAACTRMTIPYTQSFYSAFLAVERLSSRPRSSFSTSGETPLPLLDAAPLSRRRFPFGGPHPFRDAASPFGCRLAGKRRREKMGKRRRAKESTYCLVLESLRMMPRAVFSLISRCLGTGCKTPVMTLRYQSWSDP